MFCGVFFLFLCLGDIFINVYITIDTYVHICVGNQLKLRGRERRRVVYEQLVRDRRPPPKPNSNRSVGKTVQVADSSLFK